MSAEPPRNSALVRIAVGPLARPVLSRVVGMMAARADCPVDRLDDALLVVDAVAAHAGAHATDGRVTVRVSTWPDALELAVGPLREGGAEGLLQDSVLPGVGNVVEEVASGIRTEQNDDAGTDVLAIRIGFEASL